MSNLTTNYGYQNNTKKQRGYLRDKYFGLYKSLKFEMQNDQNKFINNKRKRKPY